ncbi:MAG: UvrD-helicase domain-containing protein [Verrucomicrobiota bacterium]
MDPTAKNLLIEASAGSGKTWQLGNRIIARICAGACPSRIVALTFTRKAAGEFIDSVLTKLADASLDPGKAAELAAQIHNPAADFPKALAGMVRVLPRITFGTIDSYFARVVRSFQFELGLTGGRFELLEGPRAAAALEDLLARILDDLLDDDAAEEFLLAFRRSQIGREGIAILPSLKKFVDTWYGHYRRGSGFRWAPDGLPKLSIEDWEKHRPEFSKETTEAWAALEAEARTSDAVTKIISDLAGHTIGSGSFQAKGSLSAAILEDIAAGQTDELELTYYRKKTTVPKNTATLLRGFFLAAAAAEMGAAITRTNAIRSLLSHYDAHRSSALRRNGRLGFDDVKHLMGAWATSEDARLRREAVDFRLDSATDHWLLDEFQDTSRADWDGLSTLIDEAVTRQDASVFVVGDRKQAIYAWRGGDVTLFDHLISRYGTGEDHPHRLEVRPMADSRRSCPQVLELVNNVCGDKETIARIFGAETAARWKWDEHKSAGDMAKPENAGEARVMRSESREQRLDLVVALLHEKEIGVRDVSCGILLRTRKQVQEYAEHLRENGFDVIEEGVRKPASDNAAGVTLHHFLRWLADPSDPLVRGILAMSPFASQLAPSQEPAEWAAAWRTFTTNVAATGFSHVAARLVSRTSASWSEFELRRAGDIIEALSNLNEDGVTDTATAASLIGRLEVPQPPGSAAVQVMTIHKSKGLGFDMVVVPEIPKDSTPDAGDFKAAEGEDWICDVPPQWARAIIPEIAACEDAWGSAQRYENLCVLYVALTRAKRGLYVFLPEFANSHDPDKASIANWLLASLGADPNDEEFDYHTGNPEWHSSRRSIERPAAVPSSEHPLPPPVTRRTHLRPSAAAHASANFAGMTFGAEVHAILDSVAWLDECPADFGNTDAARSCAALIRESALRAIFERPSGNTILLREQPIDAIIGDKIITGVIDRLHLHSDQNGNIVRARIIDFKTDAVKSAADLTARHGPQLEAYRSALAKIYPAATIECVLVSVRLRSSVVF